MFILKDVLVASHDADHRICVSLKMCSLIIRTRADRTGAHSQSRKEIKNGFEIYFGFDRCFRIPTMFPDSKDVETCVSCYR